MAEEGKTKGLQKLKAGKLVEILIVLIAVTIAAIVLFDLFAKGEKEEDAADYGEELGARLARVLSEIDGAGEVAVMVGIASDGEKVIAVETTESADGTIVTAPVFVGGEVVVLEEKKPKISGVVIVAEGADDLNVRFNLLAAASSVLNIDQSIIKVYTKG